MNKIFNNFTLAVAVIVAIFGLQYIGNRSNGELMAQAGLRQPVVSSNASYSALSVKWTAGTLNNGGAAVTVTASSAALTALQTDCSAPLLAACNILWANSAGTITVTATSAGIKTASVPGSTILAYIQTSQTAITKLAFPYQSNVATQSNFVINNCGTSVSCASTVATNEPITHMGAVTVASGSAVTIYGLAPAFTSTSTYGCVVEVAGATATLVNASYARTAAGSITLFIAVPTGAASETVTYECRGY